MGHDHEHKPEIDILASENPAEKVVILADPGTARDRGAIEAQVEQIAGSLEAVVESGVFVHWADEKPQPMVKQAEVKDNDTESYGPDFTPDSAVDDGAGVPHPSADDHADGDPSGGDGESGMPDPTGASDYVDPRDRRRDEDEEPDDAEPPPPDDDKPPTTEVL